MKFTTIDPASGQPLKDYETMEWPAVETVVSKSRAAFESWRRVPLTDRLPFYSRLAGVLRDNSQHYASLITREMGKPISESLALIEKCAWMTDVYVENAGTWLAAEDVKADGKVHRVSYEPLGVVLSIMPWNFPFWQALRFGVPTTMAGNTTILKHSNSVPECALAIEDAFRRAGFPEGIFSTIIADHETVGQLIAHEDVGGVSFTGSTEAGQHIASLTGRHLKKVVLELGGSDPFIVMDDADLEFTVEGAVLGRCINTGQSCIASKRFIVHESLAEAFSERLAEKFRSLRIGDPAQPDTQIGPLVNMEAVAQINGQVGDAIAKGARVLTGGKPAGGPGFFYEPTVLAGVTADMRVMSEEVFGPVAPVITFKSDEEAVMLANMTEFGLGGSIWTRDLDRGMDIAGRVDAGSVFVNHITKSDPRLPFGGVKKSGMGRELAWFGLREFTNVKSLNVYEQPDPSGR